jgi:hypothetical protein
MENLIEAGMVNVGKGVTPQELILEGELLGARLEQFGVPGTVPIIDLSR